MKDICATRDILEAREADGIERRIDLERAIAQLTAKQREVLALWLEGYTQEEIAERCGIGQQRVCRRLQRAKARLRVIMLGRG